MIANQTLSCNLLHSSVCTVSTGYEPRRLFNVVQFVMNDKEGLGNVSLEGAMQILYLRYGRGLLDAQLEESFGTSDLNSGNTISFHREDNDANRVPSKLAFKSDQAATEQSHS